MSASVSSELNSIPLKSNKNIEDIESDSSIEIENNIKSSDDSDSDVEHVPTSGAELAIRNINRSGHSQSMASHQNNDSPPNIGTVTVQNSANPMFGNKTSYKGPVTINQFITEEDNGNKWKKKKTHEYETTEFMNNSANQRKQTENGIKV